MVLALTVFHARSVQAASPGSFGNIGDPINLVVGYQPYFAPAWSGAIVRSQHFQERYLPAGSTVEFQIGIKGAGVITKALLSGEESLAYLGNAPTLTVTSSVATDGTKIRIIATAGLGHDLCNVLLVRRDAPSFASTQEALAWLGQRTFAVPHGTCAHAFALELLKRAPAQPRIVLDQTADLISRGFATGRVDAAVVWEPFASQMVQSGLARRAASGASIDVLDGSFLVVRDDLLTQRPDVVKAWLRAELDAQRFLADTRNRQIIVRTIAEQTSGLSTAAIERGLYGPYPKSQGGLRERVILPFDVTPTAIDLLNRTAVLLSGAGRLTVTQLPADAVRAELARQILSEPGAPQEPMRLITRDGND
jgi:NitT/TauT family transport system substrate-binding protein